MFEKVVVLQRRRSFFVKKTFFFSNIVISRVLREEREHTDTPTHRHTDARINSLGGGWGGRRGGLERWRIGGAQGGGVVWVEEEGGLAT